MQRIQRYQCDLFDSLCSQCAQWFKTPRNSSVGFRVSCRLLTVTFMTAALLLGTADSRLVAQQKHSAGEGWSVDVVSLKSGRTLRGAIASQQPNGSLTIAVSRDWLAGANPVLATLTLKENVEGRKAGWSKTRDRITERLKSPIDSPNLAFFLKQELERLDQLIDESNPADPDFLWIDVRHESIAKVHRAAPDQHRIALFGWDERLSHVETRDVLSLQKELTGHGVKLDVSVPDLSDRLPARIQNDEEWAVRLALMEYSLAKPLDFQGMGETLARTQEGQPANLGEILPKLLQEQLGSLLTDLTNDGRPPNKAKGESEWLIGAIRTAEREHVRGFRLTRLELDTTASRVSVETRFIAQIESGKWKTIWLHREIEDGTKARPQAEARIEQDPQLKSAIETMKLLGLADGRGLKQAIRSGAATMSAQQRADAAFAGFRDRYVRHLDSPPLSTAMVP